MYGRAVTRTKSRYSSKYILLVLFSLFMVRHMPGLLQYAQRDLLHHRAPDKVSLIGASNQHPQSYLGNGNPSLWHNEYNVVHVVHTRFMLNQGSAGLVNLAEARLELFKTFCVPAMRQQTTKQFLWIVWTDPNLDKKILSKLKHVLARVPNAVILAAHHSKKADLRTLYGIPMNPGAVEAPLVAGSRQLLMDYNIASRERLLLESRVDADDALRRNFIESVQAHASWTIGQVLRNENLLEVFCPEHHVEWRYYKPDDEDHPSGHLVHHRNRNYCQSSGMTVAYHLGASNRQFFDTDKVNVPERLPVCVDENEEDKNEVLGAKRNLRGTMDQDQKIVLEHHAQLVDNLVQRHHDEADQELGGSEVSDNSELQLAMRQRREAINLAMQFESETFDLYNRRMMQSIESEQLEGTVTNYGISPNECWRPLIIRGSEDDRFISTGVAFRAALLMSRSPTSAGMNNVIPNSFVSRHSIAKATYELDQDLAWESMAKHFAVPKTQVEHLRAQFEKNMETILREALTGQCSLDHSCKKSASKALNYLIDRVRWQKQNRLAAKEIDGKEDPHADGIVSDLTEFADAFQKAFGAVMEMVGITNSHTDEKEEHQPVSDKGDDEVVSTTEDYDPFAPSSASQTLPNDSKQGGVDAQPFANNKLGPSDSQPLANAVIVQYDDNWNKKRTDDFSNTNFVGAVTNDQEQASIVVSGGSDSVGTVDVAAIPETDKDQRSSDTASSKPVGMAPNLKDDEQTLVFVSGRSEEAKSEGLSESKMMNTDDISLDDARQKLNMSVEDATRVKEAWKVAEVQVLSDSVAQAKSTNNLDEKLSQTGLGSLKTTVVSDPEQDFEGPPEVSTSYDSESKAMLDKVMDNFVTPLNDLVMETVAAGGKSAAGMLGFSSEAPDDIATQKEVPESRSISGQVETENDTARPNNGPARPLLDSEPDVLGNNRKSIGTTEKVSKSGFLMEKFLDIVGVHHRESLSAYSTRPTETDEGGVVAVTGDGSATSATVNGKRTTVSRREAVAEFFHGVREMPVTRRFRRRPSTKALRRVISRTPKVSDVVSSTSGHSGKLNSTSPANDVTQTDSVARSIRSAKAEVKATTTTAITKTVSGEPTVSDTGTAAHDGAVKEALPSRAKKPVVRNTAKTENVTSETDAASKVLAKKPDSPAVSRAASVNAAASSIMIIPESATSLAESSDEGAVKSAVSSIPEKTVSPKVSKLVRGKRVAAVKTQTSESNITSNNDIPSKQPATESKAVPMKTVAAITRRDDETTNMNSSQENPSVSVTASNPVSRYVADPPADDSLESVGAANANNITTSRKRRVSVRKASTVVLTSDKAYFTSEKAIVNSSEIPESSKAKIPVSTRKKRAARPAAVEAAAATATNSSDKANADSSPESPLANKVEIPASPEIPRASKARIPSSSISRRAKKVKIPEISAAEKVVIEPLVAEASMVAVKTKDETKATTDSGLKENISTSTSSRKVKAI